MSVSKNYKDDWRSSSGPVPFERCLASYSAKAKVLSILYYIMFRYGIVSGISILQYY